MEQNNFVIENINFNPPPEVSPRTLTKILELEDRNQEDLDIQKAI
jgi:hypothetical protein